MGRVYSRQNLLHGFPEILLQVSGNGSCSLGDRQFGLRRGPGGYGLEIEFALQRRIFPRYLPTLGRLSHFAPDLAQHSAHLDTGPLEIAQEGGCEWAVLAVAVLRRLSGRGRECDQRACGGIDRPEATEADG